MTNLTQKKLSTRGIKLFQALFAFVFLFSLLGVQPAQEVIAQGDETKIALITDYGVNISDPRKADIASLIHLWEPDAVVTAGDNYHDRSPSCSSYAECVAGYNNNTSGYTDFVGQGIFFPAYGNHDKGHSDLYRAYFNYLPGSTNGLAPLYYDVKIGNIHFWILDGNENLTATGNAQANWFKANAPDNSVAWNIVIVHQPPFGTGNFYGDITDTQLPYHEYGIDFVIGGHNHHYERLVKDSIRYFIAGKAGETSDDNWRSCSGSGSAATSEFCATKENVSSYGYMQLVATETEIVLNFIGQNGALVDTHTKTKTSSTDPVISTSVSSLATFTGQPGVTSAEQSYTVSGVRLSGVVTITPPVGFEISTTSGSGFKPSAINLTPDGGTLAATTIFVRMASGEAGNYAGKILHSSQDAAPKEVGLSGVISEPLTTSWVAYNDVVHRSGQISNKITTYTISSQGASTGNLVDYNTGTTLTGVQVAITTSGTVQYTSSDSQYDGAVPNTGTDAHSTFDGIVNMVGLTFWESNTPYIDMTFSGLDPNETYTFATSANRNNTEYTSRESVFTISGAAAATNASTTGVSALSNESVYFSTGYNTANGYVARWTGIKPSEEGGFKVRVQGRSSGTSYGPSVFMLAQEGVSSTEPTIYTSVSSLTGFSAQPGQPSSAKNYTVSGINLIDGVTITPPAGFEISETSGSEFSTSAITLPSPGGTLATTTIYVRLAAGAAGSFSGNITHDSNQATTRNVAVNGTVSTTPPWTAYNDMSGTSTPANTTEFTLGQTNGMLLDFDTGEQTGVTVTVNFDPASGQTGTPFNYSDGGSMPDSGTDAYEIFNNKVNLQGVIMSATSNERDYWVDVVFDGLNPGKTYTFAATTNRAGGSSYLDRETRFTISGMDAATYASSSGATKIDDHSVYFVTGENTSTGYVARWVNIQPGSDGSFKVRAQPQDSNEPRTYAFGAFMLQEEAVTVDTFTLSAAVSPVNSGTVNLSPAGGTYLAGTTVTLTPSPAEGYQFDKWSGANAEDIIEDSGAFSIVMNGNKSVTGVFKLIPNNPPTDILLSNSLVFENVSIGSQVGELTTVDPDSGDTHTYTLVESNTHPDNDAFQITGDKLLTAIEFDYATKDQYTIKIRSTDAGGLFVEKNFEIYIIQSGTVPVLPSNFYGGIYFMVSDGEPSSGDLLEAYLDNKGTPIRSVPIKTAGDNLIYSINVPAYPDGTHPSKVTFKIGNRVLAVADWASGTNVMLDLHPPKANAGGAYAALLGDGSLTLNGSYTDWKDPDNFTFAWDLDADGEYDDATIASPSFPFTETGTTIVGLKVIDGQGGEGIDTALVFVVALSGLEGQVYNGQPHPVTVEGVDTPYTTTVLYGPAPGSTTPPTNAGTYDVLVQIKDSEGNVIATLEAELVIAKATATVTLDPESLNQIYDGEPKEVIATTEPEGLTVTITYDGSETPPSATGSYYVVATVVDDNYEGSTEGTMTIGIIHVIDLVAGWNLISFMLEPISTDIADVLKPIDGKYSLVYAWDATGVHPSAGNWVRYDPVIPYGNTLTELDHTMGFWIYMEEAAQLSLIGNDPGESSIQLVTTVGGWNLVGYPSMVNRDLPGALEDFGVEDFTLVYAFHAADTADQWKLFSSEVPFGNDLTALAPGWGYWIFMTIENDWIVNFK
ncbi:MAG: MBG domain-containing protein [Anaerolineaceae bacterium]